MSMKLGDLEVRVSVAEGRAGWTFPYRGQDVARAAERRANYHRERETFYAGEAERLEAELRTSGIQLREHQQTGGPTMTAVLDPERALSLQEVRSKRDNHARYAVTFEAYAGAMRDRPDLTYYMTVADVEYFGMYREEGA